MKIGSSSCRGAVIGRFLRLVRRNSAPDQTQEDNTMYIRSAPIALAALAFAVAAHASPIPSSPWESEPPSVTISIADLDLGRQDGVKAVLQRIHRAAVDVCTGYLAPDACMRDTMTRAIATLDSPIVTAMYYRRAPRTTILASSRR